MSMQPDPDYAEREFVEGRAYVDWDRRGAIVRHDTGEVIGNAMTDLSDETLASGVPDAR